MTLSIFATEYLADKFISINLPYHLPFIPVLSLTLETNQNETVELFYKPYVAHHKHSLSPDLIYAPYKSMIENIKSKA